MNMMEATKTCFSKYFTMSGRARRAEYWWFYLFVVIVSVVLGIVDALGDTLTETGILSTVWSLATLIPSFTASVRRLHDTDRSGWWQLLWLIPIIGWIILLVWMCSKGTEGPNRFGADPLRPHNVGEVFA
jgi:uncharacterized membrane protein YhaH (DUF805 family)